MASLKGLITSFTNLPNIIKNLHCPGSALGAGDTEKSPCCYGAYMQRETGQTQEQMKKQTWLDSENYRGAKKHRKRMKTNGAGCTGKSC